MKTKNDILIKVLSLSIGLSVGIVLIAKVFFELSYDSFYKDIDRVYTIRNYYSQNGDEHDYGQVSGAVSVGFMEEVPGIEVGTRTTFVFNGDTYLDADGNKLKGILVCADTCFFKVFDRPILAGDPVQVLRKWGSVMVNRSFAEKMGGVQECIGKQIANADMDGLKMTVSSIADQYECSPEFYELLNIRFVEGRAPRDSSEVVVDEKFVQKMARFTDWSDGAVGKQVFITGHGGNGMMDKGYFTISGVYKNYLIGNLQDVDERPGALFYGEIGSMAHWMPHILFKVRPDALEKVRGALNEALPDKEINIVSYAEEMRAAYADSKKMRNTMALGVVFSLLIALLGLIGFIKDESLRRSKEMAVRKINGATTRNILSIFAKDIMKLSAVMAVIACAAAFFVAHKWLEQFAEKISLNPLYFIGGAALTLLIVLSVVVLNCLKIARANPVDSLKNE